MPSDKLNQNTGKNKKSENTSSLPTGKPKYPSTKKEIKKKGMSKEKQELIEELDTLTLEELNERKDLYIKNGLKTKWFDAHKKASKETPAQEPKESGGPEVAQTEEEVDEVKVETPEPMEPVIDEEEIEKQKKLAILYERKEKIDKDNAEIRKENAEIRAALEVIMKQIEALPDDEETDIEAKKTDIEKRRQEEKEKLRAWATEAYEKSAEHGKSTLEYLESLSEKDIISIVPDSLNPDNKDRWIEINFKDGNRRVLGNVFYNDKTKNLKGIIEEAKKNILEEEKRAKITKEGSYEFLAQVNLDDIDSKYDAELAQLKKPGEEGSNKESVSASFTEAEKGTMENIKSEIVEIFTNNYKLNLKKIRFTKNDDGKVFVSVALLDTTEKNLKKLKNIEGELGLSLSVVAKMTGITEDGIVNLELHDDVFNEIDNKKVVPEASHTNDLLELLGKENVDASTEAMQAMMELKQLDEEEKLLEEKNKNLFEEGVKDKHEGLFKDPFFAKMNKRSKLREQKREEIVSRIRSIDEERLDKHSTLFPKVYEVYDRIAPEVRFFDRDFSYVKDPEGEYIDPITVPERQWKFLKQINETEGFFEANFYGFYMILKNSDELKGEKGIAAYDSKAIYKVMGPDGRILIDNVSYNEANSIYRQETEKYKVKLEEEFKNVK